MTPITVDVYRNLHRAGHNRSTYVWSIKQNGKVIGHTKMATILRPRFVVHESTRQRIIREGCRGVCAFFRGEMVKMELPANRGRRVSFNPFELPYFYWCDTREKVNAADLVVLTDKGAYAVMKKESRAAEEA